MRILAAQPLALLRPANAPRAHGPGATHAGLPSIPERPRMVPVRWALLGCLAVAALTLLFPSTPTYDPWAWLLWGREITHLDLVTNGGPSWKPLPVLFAIPFSLFGAAAEPYLWLWIARAGALLSLVMAYRLTRTLVGRGAAGVVGGLLAAAFLVTGYQYVRDSALGNSEAILAAVFLWAFERHLEGRRDHALWLGFVAALLRPEVWPFLGVYGLWLFFREPRLRIQLVVFALAIPVLWFGPELWGSGQPFRASSRATNPNPGSAAYAAHPGLEVARRFLARAVIPLQAATLVAAGYAALAWWRSRREGATLALLGIGLAWIALVAFMTEHGYAGNQRYLIITTAAICVLGGVGMARIFQGIEGVVARRSGDMGKGLVAASAVFVVGALALSPVIKSKVDNTHQTLDELRYEASLWHTLPAAIDKAGGEQRLLSCGSVYSGPFQTQMVAFQLGVHGIQVGALGKLTAPGVTFRTHTVPHGPLVARVTDHRFREVAHSGRWQIWTAPRSDARGSSCPAAPGAPRVKPTARTPELTSSR
jgi:hypothetical protein